MLARYSPIALILFCISGCWRLADPGGCKDWELYDYTLSGLHEYNECPKRMPCFSYTIEACLATVGVRFSDAPRLITSEQLQKQVRDEFEKLLVSTGSILAGCQTDQIDKPIVVHGGGATAQIDIHCDRPVAVPKAKSKDTRPFSIRRFSTPQ